MSYHPVSNCVGELAQPDIKWFLEQNDVVMIHVGSLEQHSYHLPTLCDAMHGFEITKRISKATDVPYYPMIWTGYSPQHMKQPGMGWGSVTLRPSTFMDMCYDVARSAIHHGWNKIVFVFSHASNNKVIDPVLRKLRYETGAFVGILKPYSERDLHLIKDVVTSPLEDTAGWHSAEMETAEIMAIDERLVHMDRAVRERTHTPSWLPKSFIKEDGAADVLFEGERLMVFPMDHNEFTDSGVIGDPFQATKEKGERFLQLYTDYGIKAINEIKKLEIPPLKKREFDCRADW